MAGDRTVSKAVSLCGLWRPLLLLALVIAGLVLAKAFGLERSLRALQPWIASLGPWGPVAFVALFVAASLVAIPGSVLFVAGGLIFGALWGIVWVSLASVLAAALCFLIGRYFARDALEASLGHNPRFVRLKDLTERHGALIVAITRLVPILPFTLLNYGFGLTRVPFATYLFWTWLCMLPVTVLIVVGSDAVRLALAEGRVPWGLVAVVLVMTVLMLLVGRFARRKLAEKEGKSLPQAPTQGGERTEEQKNP